MHKPWCNRRREICRTIIVVVSVLGTVTMPRLAKAEGPLQLEVLLNGKPIGFIGAFWQNAEGQLSAKRTELEGLHLKVPDRFGPEDDVALASLREFLTATMRRSKRSIL